MAKEGYTSLSRYRLHMSKWGRCSYTKACLSCLAKDTHFGRHFSAACGCRYTRRVTCSLLQRCGLWYSQQPATKTLISKVELSDFAMHDFRLYRFGTDGKNRQPGLFDMCHSSTILVRTCTAAGGQSAAGSWSAAGEVANVAAVSYK
jgi:hypothetical protein